MRNGKAVSALLVGLLALAVMLGAAAAAHFLDQVGLAEAVAAVPLGGVLALLSLSLATSARRLNQRTLGRSGGEAFATAARVLGATALVLALTGALAVVVFLLLLLVR